MDNKITLRAIFRQKYIEHLHAFTHFMLKLSAKIKILHVEEIVTFSSHPEDELVGQNTLIKVCPLTVTLPIRPAKHKFEVYQDIKIAKISHM